MKYNFVNEPVNKSVVIITPTTGSTKLADAVNSVNAQTYKNLTHLVVVDGPEYIQDTMKRLPVSIESNSIINCVPFNTGNNGFNGQRIYAAFPHLVDADYIFFLDQDNWYEPDHVESLVKVLEQGNDFAFSFRQIYTEDKKFVCNDDCESLGKWPIYFTHGNPQYLIDTSSFAFKKEFIQKTCHLWHSGPWGEDRRYFYAIKDHVRYDTNYKHSMCYRLGGNEKSVQGDFFIKGNEEQLRHYEGKLPWMK